MRDVFARLYEIAEVMPTERWMLVGGLMVHAHASMAGITHPRPTDDADLVVELRSASYAQLATTLESLGYVRHEPVDHASPFHRFARADEHVDMMAPENRSVSFGGREVLRVPGSRSALRRTVDWQAPQGRAIRIPDVESALSLKGAAFQTSSPNRERHLEDAVTLFACSAGVDLEVSKSMRANINLLLKGLSSRLDAWGAAEPRVRRAAIRSITAYQPSWLPPIELRRQRF